jgi:5-methylcytosine-specific restriction enzyme subunit McrC
MRTIVLKEHQPKPESLSRTERANLLAASDIVSIVPLPDEEGLYELRAGSKVGTLVFSELRVLIRPKVDLTNIFYLLGFGEGLTKWDPAVFPYQSEPDLLQAVGWAFEAETGRSLRHGIVRGYVPREEALSTIRGRIDIGRQQSLRQTRPLPLACRFDDYTEDIELNHLVRAAHTKLRAIPTLDIELAKRLLYRQRSFADVSEMEFHPLAVPHLEFNRLNEHWEGTGRLAELILRQETLRDQEGVVMGSSFLVDMNVLFERFVTRIVAEEAESAGWKLIPQAKRSLAPGIGMRPDFVLSRDGVDFAVGDAKYKELAIQGWPRPDLYQLLAYCSALGLPEGLLIYGDTQEPEAHVVHRAGIRLEVVGIDLTKPPKKLALDARLAAWQLIEQANWRRRVENGSEGT